MKLLMTISALTALTACQQESSPVANATDEATAGEETLPPMPPPKADRRVLAPQQGRVSQYTPLDPAVCKLVEESEEGPYWRRRCEGIGGYAVEWTESDLRQNVTVVSPKGVKTSLDLPSKVATGAFDRLGPRIEWRGPAGKGPDVLVVRVHVANDQGEDDGGHLAVARLKPKPCLIGSIAPAANQSQRARALADKGGSCV